jgi:hypothetical protein
LNPANNFFEAAWNHFLADSCTDMGLAAGGVRTMASRGDEFRVKAIECVEHAARARDPEAKCVFQELARGWWQLAEQADKAAAAHPLATLKMMK